MAILVSIIEDDQITRESLGALLDRSEQLRCYHQYASAELALPHVLDFPPDVLLVDINLPGRNGIQCITKIRQSNPNFEILVLTVYDDADFIFDALRAGANGYILKRSPAAEIIDAIQEVSTGGSPMSAQIARKVVSYFRPSEQGTAEEIERLTAREYELLTYLVKGLQYKEIGLQLGISISTVRSHLHTIYKKLHVQSRTEAVIKFLKK